MVVVAEEEEVAEEELIQWRIGRGDRVHVKSVREQSMPRTGESADAAHVFTVISKPLAPKYIARSPQPSLILLCNPSAYTPPTLHNRQFPPLASRSSMLLFACAPVFVHRACVHVACMLAVSQLVAGKSTWLGMRW